MAALPKSSVVVRFGKLDQKRAPKNHILGTLEQAINVRQRELGRHSTRYGYSSVNTTTDSGTISDAYALGVNAGSAVLQTSNAVYIRDTTNSIWRNKGTHHVCMPGQAEIVFSDKGARPTHVVSGTLRYEFAQKAVAGGGSFALWYRVVDTATNIERQAATQIGSEAGFHPRAIVAGGYVWLFWMTSLGVVKNAKFDPASVGTAPTIATFFTGSGGAAVVDIDVIVPTGSSTCYVAMCGNNIGAGGTEDVCVRTLDTSTGIAVVSPRGDYAEGNVHMVRWLQGTAVADGQLWLAINDSGSSIELIGLHPTTLALVSDVDVATGLSNVQGIDGYKSGNDRVVFVTFTQGTDPKYSYVTRYVYDGSSTTNTNFGRATWVASRPFQVGTGWYVVTGHDDASPYTPYIPLNLQRSYQLRDATSTTYTNIRARALYGLGGDAWQNSENRAGSIGAGVQSTGYSTQVSVSGTTATVLLNGQTGTTDSYDYSTYRVTFEFASLGSAMTQVDDAETIIPGGWPRRIVNEALFSDLVPMMYPSHVSASATNNGGSLTAGVYGVAVVYKMTDPRGNVARSAPWTGSVTTAGGNLTATLVIPYLRHLSSNTFCEIEIYATTINGSVYTLQTTFANDPTTDTVTKHITSIATGGEGLYTAGGVLSNYPPPPFRGSFLWNDRLWAFGTEFPSEAWHTKQFASGITPEWAPPLKVTCYGGSGSLRAGGVLSSDYAVLFKRDAVFAVSGSGPDDTGGGGSFQVRRLNWDGGCEHHASVVSYPGGLLFQGLDGLIYRITPGLSVDDPGADAQDYASATVYRAIHLPKYREVRFYLSTGKILVLDYGQANENAPNGYWYVDESSAWGAGVGAIVLSDLAQFVSSAGVVWSEVANQYFDATSTTIATKCDVNTLQLADLGGEVRISRIQFLGEYHSAHDLRISVAADGGSATNYDKTSISASPEHFDVRPGGCGRVSALDVSIERTGSGTGQGFSFDGLVIEVQPRGRAKRVNSTQRI